MSNWDWFDEYEYNARASGDEQRCRLGQLHRDAYRFRETDPDRAIDLLSEGRRIAETLREPWWVLYYDQQRVHALLHFKQDFRNVLDLAVRNTLEVRKPAYRDFPRRLLIHLDLVSCYLGIDPVGYADAVLQAMAYLEGEVEPVSDDRYLLLGSQRQFELDMGNLPEALEMGRRSLALAAEDPEPTRARHFLVFTYSGLAEIAFRQGDGDALVSAALDGEEMARRVGHQVELAGFQLWRALAARRRGDETTAVPLYRQAVNRLSRLGMPPDASYRDAECAYHEAAGDLDWAVGVREAELQAIEGHGRLAYKAEIHTKRCELLARLETLTNEDLTRAREAVARLRAPSRWLARLDRLGRDCTGEQGRAP